jgi:pyruvate dehydrogenase E1 component alpha subunit
MEYSPELLERFYKEMIRIRCCEESLVDPILSGEIICPCHLYSGQEAIATGICASLNADDYVFGNHRSHGHFLAKGGDMRQMMAEIYGRESGCSGGRGGSMHLIDADNGMMGSAPIVAGTISLATGAALAASLARNAKVAVSFFGDGAAGEGVLYECLNFASLKKLPILFVCENNLYSTHMPILECRVESNIYKVAEPFCIAAMQVDGNDVLAVYEAGRSSVEKCRKGDGPVFIECLTYRLRGHVGPDDNIQGTHTDLRPKEELDAWSLKDPIIRFKKYLLDNGISDKEQLERIERGAEAEAGEAHAFARSCVQPEREALTNYVFK